MSLISANALLNLKLNAIKIEELRLLAQEFNVLPIGSATQLIKAIHAVSPNSKQLDEFIRQQYLARIEKRRNLISDADLICELNKVKEFRWGVKQGQLDQKIQSEYVRGTHRYDELIEKVKSRLHKDITGYVVCTWYNHWTTVLIEEHISQHNSIVPTLKNIKGIDIFFRNQPFDLKVTYVPEYYDVEKLSNPSHLAIWMFENQGAQRFGADNRLFIILYDKSNPERSWELKREFNLVFDRIDRFFDSESVSAKDEIVFTFNHRTFTTVAKVLVVSK